VSLSAARKTAADRGFLVSSSAIRSLTRCYVSMGQMATLLLLLSGCNGGVRSPPNTQSNVVVAVEEFVAKRAKPLSQPQKDVLVVRCLLERNLRLLHDQRFTAITAHNVEERLSQLHPDDAAYIRRHVAFLNDEVQRAATPELPWMELDILSLQFVTEYKCFPSQAQAFE
jgi:hypothetical protein